MRSTRGLIVTIVALGLIGVGAWYWVSRPQGPSLAEVNAKWPKVQGWTGVDGPLGQPVFAFGAGLDASTRTPHVPALSDYEMTSEVAPLGTDDMPAAYLAQIDALLAWGAKPRFEGTCADDGLGPFVIHDRLRAALAIAGPADIDRAKAVLRVAMVLRARGSLILTFIGLEATLQVARWAKARGVPIWPELRAAGPTPEGFVRAMAREAVCVDALMARSMRDDDASLPLAMRQLSQVRAHDSLAPLQIPDPTFDALRPLLGRAKPGNAVEAKLAEVMDVNREMMLEKFEAAAQDFAALVGE